MHTDRQGASYCELEGEGRGFEYETSISGSHGISTFQPRVDVEKLRFVELNLLLGGVAVQQVQWFSGTQRRSIWGGGTGRLTWWYVSAVAWPFCDAAMCASAGCDTNDALKINSFEVMY